MPIVGSVPRQRYSVFAGKAADSDDYAIIFLVFEKGKGSAINAGKLKEEHYQTLSRFGMWPDDWQRESETKEVENQE